jgi:hypothetical protein
MEESVWELILYKLKITNYTEGFIFLCLLITTFILLKNWQKDKVYLALFTYTIFSIFFFISAFLSFSLNIDSTNRLGSASDILFALIEYYVFYLFFSKAINSKKITLILKYFLIVLFFACIYFFLFFLVKDKSNTVRTKYCDILIGTELFFLAIVCLFYFHFLFEDLKPDPLFSRPSFWITSGLLFYSLIIAPFFIISDRITQQSLSISNALFSVHFFSLGLLYLAIAKAALCKKPITT